MVSPLRPAPVPSTLFLGPLADSRLDRLTGPSRRGAIVRIFCLLNWGGFALFMAVAILLGGLPFYYVTGVLVCGLLFYLVWL